MEKKLCRLCLTTTVCHRSIKSDNIVEKVKALTDIDLLDEVEESICCTKCILNLNHALTIRNNFLRGNDKFSILNKTEADEPNQAEDPLRSEPEVEIVAEPCQFKVESDMDIDNVQLTDFENEDQLNNAGENLLSNNVQLPNAENEDHISIADEDSVSIETVEIPSEERVKVQFPKNQTSAKVPTIMLTKKFKCLICNAIVTENQKSNHIQLHKKVKKIEQKSKVNVSHFEKFKFKDESNLQCLICLKNFKNRNSLMAHTHNRKECPTCKKQVLIPNYVKHMENHREDPQMCDVCGKTLRNKEHLRAHLSYAHVEKRFYCKLCDRKFLKNSQYSLHMKKHSGEKNVVCETCGKAFYEIERLRTHVKCFHLKIRSYHCEFCKRNFSSRHSLATHRRQHTNETPYKCEVCGDGFRQNVSLVAHRKSKHNIIPHKDIACTVCGKMFGCQQAILAHMRIH